LASKWTQQEILQRVLRPRVLVYSVILLALSVGLVVSLALRTPLKVDVMRDRTSLARIAEGGRLENVYRLQVMNATEGPMRYRVTAEGLEGLTVLIDGDVAVEAAQSRWVAVRLQIPYGSASPGSHPVRFQIRSESGAMRVSEKSVFLVPR
jgi:polyferredoxin